MKAEYDFSNAERGKFYHPNAKFNIPIYLLVHPNHPLDRMVGEMID